MCGGVWFKDSYFPGCFVIFRVEYQFSDTNFKLVFFYRLNQFQTVLILRDIQNFVLLFR